MTPEPSDAVTTIVPAEPTGPAGSVDPEAGPGPALAAGIAGVEADAAPQTRRRLRILLHDPGTLVSGAFLLLVLAVTVLAPLIAPHDPSSTDLQARFASPLSDGHLLGTDDLGRDLFSRLLHAGRVSLLVGLGSVALAMVIAVPIGLLAGYVGGKTDAVLSAAINVVLSVPPLILVFTVAGILGPSVRNVVIALAIYFVPVFVRLVRSEVKVLRYGQLVETERAIGISDTRIVLRHVLPNISASVIVQASLNVGTAILAEASLSFLGLGVRPPTPSWGVMLRDAYDYVRIESWVVFVPGITVALVVFALNVFGDGLRDALGRVTR
ncbi:MAG: ABC transporter permease [Acidimicrobiia bacterium]